LSEKNPSKKPREASPKEAAPRATSSGKVPLGDSGPMDVSLLERIVKLMQANDLSVVDLRDGRRRVMLQRGSISPVMSVAPHPSSHSPIAPPPSPNAAETENAKLLEIKSPMVGTFYAASSPDAKPFVGVGSEVTEETDVCVIEAMKVFNNVKADCHGSIAKIMVTNGQVVEFGQVLFLVKP
jgi:acetyl-CoA carboxylase biotin carboxyl carrier protein